MSENALVLTRDELDELNANLRHVRLWLSRHAGDGAEAAKRELDEAMAVIVAGLQVDDEGDLGVDFGQLELGAWHRDDPDTSRRAALDNYPRSGTQRERVLAAVIRAGGEGITFDELEEATGIFSADRRLTELKAGKWIAGAGERPTRRRSAATVYVATDKAIEWHRPAGALTS